MKIIFFVTMIAGAILGLGELAYSKYFAGEKLIEGVLFDADNTNVGVEFTVSQTDLPVRINLTAYGWLDFINVQPIGRMEFSNGKAGEGDIKLEHFIIDEENVLSKASVGSTTARLNLKDYYLRSYQSILFDTATPGFWIIKGKPIEENDFKFQTVEGTIIIKSKAINWYLAGSGLLFMLLGMIGFIATMKADDRD